MVRCLTALSLELSLARQDEYWGYCRGHLKILLSAKASASHSRVQLWLNRQPGPHDTFQIVSDPIWRADLKNFNGNSACKGELQQAEYMTGIITCIPRRSNRLTGNSSSCSLASSTRPWQLARISHKPLHKHRSTKAQCAQIPSCPDFVLRCIRFVYCTSRSRLQLDVRCCSLWVEAFLHTKAAMASWKSWPTKLSNLSL